MTTLTRRPASITISYSVEQCHPSRPAQNGAFVWPRLHWNSTNTTSTSSNFDLPLIAQASTSGMLATERGGPVEDRRDVQNRRRVFLINKKYQTPEGLSRIEVAELDLLQQENGRYLDSLQPPPFEELRQFEALVGQLSSEEEDESK